MPNNHKLNLIVLVALVSATMMGWLWVWGLFFIYLSYQAYIDEATFVITPIRKSETPVIYWIVSVFWFLVGASYLVMV